jgi:hypothetical protein
LLFGRLRDKPGLVGHAQLMNVADMLHLRLRNQLIAAETRADSPAKVVERLCAMQAQDYSGSLWAVGLRCSTNQTVADVERALAERRIVRTWPMRGTLHLIAPGDVRWMLALLAPRPLARASTRERQLGFDSTTFARARRLLSSEMAGGRLISRPDAMALLEADGIGTQGQRGYHILWRLAQEGLLVLGPVRDKQQTFALLDEWVAPGTAEQDALPREVGLCRLAERYFAAHGPATIADFARWAGITKSDARTGLSGVAEGHLARLEVDGSEYWLSADSLAASQEQASRVGSDAQSTAVADPDVDLLPGFDEYLLGYADRGPQLAEHFEMYGSTVSSNGMFSATMVIDGRVQGVWRRVFRRDHVEVTVRGFRRLKASERRSLCQATERYGEFVGLHTKLSIE